MPRLSAIIIAKDEAANIAACLDSVAFADERIVVDSGSTDETMAIARAKGAKVYANEFRGFGAQKNFALTQATGDWVFSIDADERVSAALRAQIEQAIGQGTQAGFEMPRRSTFCGKVIRHSGWYPDHVLRLFKRGSGRFSEDLVHERVICDGSVGRLSEPILHDAVARLEDALDRLDRYSTASAQMKASRGQRVSFAAGIVHGAFAFFRSYLLRGGFLDGREGFLIAVLVAENSYYAHMKAWLLTRNR